MSTVIFEKTAVLDMIANGQWQNHMRPNSWRCLTFQSVLIQTEGQQSKQQSLVSLNACSALFDVTSLSCESLFAGEFTQEPINVL